MEGHGSNVSHGSAGTAAHHHVPVEEGRLGVEGGQGATGPALPGADRGGGPLLVGGVPQPIGYQGPLGITLVEHGGVHLSRRAQLFATDLFYLYKKRARSHVGPGSSLTVIA